MLNSAHMIAVEESEGLGIAGKGFPRRPQSQTWNEAAYLVGLVKSERPLLRSCRRIARF